MEDLFTVKWWRIVSSVLYNARTDSLADRRHYRRSALNQEQVSESTKAWFALEATIFGALPELPCKSYVELGVPASLIPVAAGTRSRFFSLVHFLRIKPLND